jgi:hypothetical protein
MPIRDFGVRLCVLLLPAAMTNRPAPYGFGHYSNTVWFEAGGCEPLSDHAYAAILNYLEEEEKVEAL